MKLTTFTLIIFDAFLLAMGQIMWKVGLNKVGKFSFENIISTSLGVYIAMGICLYFFATLIWLHVLSKTELSLAYPLQSVAYIFAMFAAFFLLDESIKISGWIGVFLIITGVYFISM